MRVTTQKALCKKYTFKETNGAANVDAKCRMIILSGSDDDRCYFVKFS